MRIVATTFRGGEKLGNRLRGGIRSFARRARARVTAHALLLYRHHQRASSALLQHHRARTQRSSAPQHRARCARCTYAVRARIPSLRARATRCASLVRRSALRACATRLIAHHKRALRAAPRSRICRARASSRAPDRALNIAFCIAKAATWRGHRAAKINVGTRWHQCAAATTKSPSLKRHGAQLCCGSLNCVVTARAAGAGSAAAS